MGAFCKGNSGSNYRVDELCDAANSADHNQSNAADHNQSNAAYCNRRRGMVRFLCLSVRKGNNQCKNGGTDRDAVWLG